MRAAATEDEPLYRIGEAIVAIAVRRENRFSLHLRTGIAHGDAETSSLEHRDIVAAVTGRIFPRRFIQGLRKTFDRVSSRPARRATDPSHDIDFKTAQSILAADRDYVASLFAQYPIQLGTGEAFLWDDPHTEKGRCSS